MPRNALFLLALLPALWRAAPAWAQGSGHAVELAATQWIDAGPPMNALDFPYAIEVWLRIDALGVPHAVWNSCLDPSGIYHGIWLIVRGSGQVSWTYSDGTGDAGGSRRTHTTVPALPTGTWVHVAAVQDDPLNARLYINGVQVPTSTDGTGLLSIADSPSGITTIGNNAYVIGDAWLEGQVDELRIWDVSRSPAEIRRDLCRRLDGTEPGLAAYWRFDEGAGPGTADAATGVQDGTFVGGGGWTWSGAAIGDTSVWAYPPAFPGPALSLPAPSGGAQVRIDNQAAPAGQGFHLYRVDRAPNTAAGLPPGADTVYWGVFGSDVSGTWDAHVDLPPVSGSCLTCALDWVDRNDNAAGPWSPVGGVVASGCSFALPGESATGEPWRTEYAWADTTAPAPAAVGPTAIAAVCPGDSVAFGGAWVSAEGLYTDTLTAAAGCDSLVFLDLSWLPPILGDTLVTAICAGDSVAFGGTWYATPGFYADTLLTSTGCDSLVFLDLTVLAPAIGPTAAVSVCAGDSLPFGGVWLSAEGLYADTLTTADGCDSLVFLDLTVLAPAIGPTAAVSVCAGDSLPFGGVWLSAEGLYADTLTTADGCDSLVFLDLTVEDCPEPDTCLVLLPNAFSPNGDGLNDGFGVPPQLCPELDRFRLEIYNRWGQRIFLALDRDRFWDGTWKGTPQELGVYVWVLRYRRTEAEAEQALTGTVTLVR